MIVEQTILVTGATGYVGGRLVPRLLAIGRNIRCMVRDPDRLRGRPWEDDVDIVAGDALDEATLTTALDGVDSAYYLIHSLASVDEDFAERDRRAAGNFGRAAARAGVRRIIYLGGIEPKGERRSKHLDSRLQTGEHLGAAGVPVTEFRAAVIVGSGSLSFELIRYLTERVPVMICPRWVKTPTQPIAIRTVLEYLVAALDVPDSTGRVIEIGGNDILTYEEMFRVYADVRGLRRLIINVPALTPRLSSLWVGFVTPLSTRIARPLIEGLDNKVVVTDDTAPRLFDVKTISYREAVRRALTRFESGDVETSWHGAFSSSIGDEQEIDELDQTEGMFTEVRRRTARVGAAQAFRVVTSLGGTNGWMYANALWRLRGLLDLLIGGVGLRRGRRSQTQVRVGDAIDFWRVEAYDENRLLRLRAEMKVPGRAWLEFRVETVEAGRQVALTQTAFFEPKGLWGLCYWYALYPIHKVIFRGMIDAIVQRAEEVASTQRQSKVRERAIDTPGGT